MKKILYSIIIGSLALPLGTSCSREEDEIFSEGPAERSDKIIADYEALLPSNGGKWEMTYFSGSDFAGQMFLVTFNANGTVLIESEHGYEANDTYNTINMVDTNDKFRSELSTWDIINDNSVGLSFSSYNSVLHVFAVPYAQIIGQKKDNSTGSTERIEINNGTGFGGDYEFTLMEHTDDYIRMVGKKHHATILLNRVDANTDSQEYFAKINELQNRLFNSKVPQLILHYGNGSEYTIEVDNALTFANNTTYESATAFTNVMRFVPMGGDAVSETSRSNFVVTSKGIRFMTPFHGLNNREEIGVQDFVAGDLDVLVSNDGDTQSTISIGDINKYFAVKKGVWSVNNKNWEGAAGEMFTTLDNAFKASSLKAKATWYKIMWKSTLNSYVLDIKVKNKETEYLLDYNFDGTDKISFKYAGVEDGSAAETYIKTIPALTDFFNALSGITFTLSSESHMTATTVKLTSDKGGAIYANIE